MTGALPNAAHRGEDFALPPRCARADGEERRVGFELEFSGIGLETTAAALQAALDARVVSRSAAEIELETADLGIFKVEIDWSFLKRKAAEAGEEHDEHEWISILSQLAELLVPIEVVCPPIPLSKLAQLEPMVKALREAGAVGTEESLISAYGVHINTEIASLDSSTLAPYLHAYALLQWWLVDKQDIDMARRVSPYIDLYSQAYLRQLLTREEPSMDQIFDDYLEYNASRNRGLDLLPLLAEIDEDRVRSRVDDPRINPRPAFHYRLPDCRIERPEWSLRPPWHSWLTVENLATRTQDLEYLAGRFLESERPLIGVSRSDWVEFIDKWLHDRELA